MTVRRLFVEKRQGYFDIPAQQLCSDLRETFALRDKLKAVRIIQRYDKNCPISPIHGCLPSNTCRASMTRLPILRLSACSW